MNIALINWLKTLSLDHYPVKALAGDASLRQYFRLQTSEGSKIVMDSSFDPTVADRFVKYGHILRRQGLKVPEIFEQDLEKGFLLVTDFGDDLYLPILNEKTADELYKKAIENLLTIQSCQLKPNETLLPYDANFYLQEMELFRQWYILEFLKKELSIKENRIISNTFEKIIKQALWQPQVFVHRDYHCRNLIHLENNQLGILDFQDARLGAITYDIASLLKDCYIEWPRGKILQWLKIFYMGLCVKKQLEKISFETFVKWFDWMGLQRHIKCLGLFVRLKIRDKKDYQWQYLPRVLNYVKQVTSNYDELNPFNEILLSLGKKQ